jgi:hypothetical protein
MSGVHALMRSRLRRPSGSLAELVAELSEHDRGSSSVVSVVRFLD